MDRSRILLLSAIMGAVLGFVGGLSVAVQHAHAQTTAGSWVSESFDDFTAFQAAWPGGGQYGSPQTTGCYLGGCVEYSTVGDFPYFYRVDLSPISNGAVSVWVKNVGNYGQELVIQTCQTADTTCSSARLDNRFFLTADGNWHLYTVAWRAGPSGVYEDCQLEDDTDLSHCGWSPDSSGLTNAATFGGLLFDATGVITSGKEIWLDQLSTLSSTFSIDWTALTPAVPFTLGTTTAAIAASSSLWSSITVASSSLDCSTGNIFSDGLCSALAYLFVPSPTTLQAFTGLPSLYTTKFPFSFFTGIQQVYSTVSASSTANFGEVKIDFSSVDPATSTPFGGFLPDAVLFSTSTVLQYIPLDMWNTFQSWIALGLWLGLAADIFFSVRNKMTRV